MKKYKLKIGLDVDEVLAECNTYALKILNKKFGTNYKVEECTSWDGGPLRSEREELFNDPDFVIKQPLYPGAKEFVKKLSQMAEVFFTTAVPLNCMSARFQRLREDFPEIPEDHIILGAAKSLYKLDLLLDDSPKNIVTSNATYPVLMRQPWNNNYSGILSVSSYEDFIHLVELINNSYTEKPNLSDGGIICLIGPSGSGKTAIAEKLVEDKSFVKPATVTTRCKRNNDSPGSYKYVSEEEFMKMKSNDEFIETTVYSDCYYGTPKKEINDVLSNKKYAVLPVDISGGITIKNIYRNKALLLFVNRKRHHLILEILSRNTDNEDKMRRIISLDDEFKNEAFCDDVINNNSTLEESVMQVKSILKAV